MTIKPVDIKAALAGRPVLRHRSPATPAAETAAAFAVLAGYRDGAVFAGSYAGDTAWERHGNGDELVQVLDGATTITILTPAGAESFTLTAGTLIIVPQGLWHRFHSPDGVTVLSMTPQPTEHSRADDPRTG